ncbi:ChaN family lipoprotein [uncultured Roseovarius sp.]|uniref:ChaN family lipoprotein n=1 Tax=uncultured Roseovarius sp. TaxID=293344 RepID=UPI00260AB8D9|nr:ChaN family lipoprotein [uncultured Roseovarius sp.]
MKHLLFAALVQLFLLSLPASSQDVLILGEVHDNPGHHQVQAERIKAFEPKAIVFEMLSAEQAARVTPELLKDQVALADVLKWSDSGWPDFSMYYPIFTASNTQIYGAAVSREVARAAMTSGIAGAFGDEADRYGLTTPLVDKEQAAREALQDGAHCDALPDNMLAPMVDIQRFRDAMLARRTVEAMAETGGPVAVITGNGHARKDWGMPAILAHVRPGLEVFVLGQTEDGAPLQGVFDEVVSSPAQQRPDPCLAFQ